MNDLFNGAVEMLKNVTDVLKSWALNWQRLFLSETPEEVPIKQLDNNGNVVDNTTVKNLAKIKAEFEEWKEGMEGKPLSYNGTTKDEWYLDQFHYGGGIAAEITSASIDPQIVKAQAYEFSPADVIQYGKAAILEFDANIAFTGNGTVSNSIYLQSKSRVLVYATSSSDYIITVCDCTPQSLFGGLLFSKYFGLTGITLIPYVSYLYTGSLNIIDKTPVNYKATVRKIAEWDIEEA